MSIPLDVSVELYRKLFLIHEAEQYIIDHYHEDEMKTPMHMSRGQEQVSVGVLHAVGERAQVFTSYRTHAAYLARTDDVDGFFAELYGKDTGPNHGKAGSMHIANPALGYQLASGIVAAQIPVAVGAAYAYKTQSNNNVAVVFFGDGALNEGAFWESLNLACLMKLPVLFVCEDNGYAVHTPTRLRQGFDHVAVAVRAFRCRAFVTLSTDVERIHNLAADAIEYMDVEPCPTFLAIRCYRYLEHVGVNEDYDAGYRTQSELEVWRRRDAVLLQRQRLGKLGVGERAIEQLETGVKERIKDAVAKAQAAPFPPAERGWLITTEQH